MTDHTKHLTLPITGMTCANCVATVERNIKKLDGVDSAVVNLSSERAAVEFNPEKLSLIDVVKKVESAGYGIAVGEAEILIKRLADSNDATRLENSLSQLEGVLEVNISYTTEKAKIKYIPTIINQSEIRKRIKDVGFDPVEIGLDAEDAEAKAREHEFKKQRNLLITGLVFKLPLFIISMSNDFNLLDGILSRNLINWIMFVL